MISDIRQTYPQLSIRRLCHLLGINRAWLSTRAAQPPQAERDLDLRDAIEQVVLEFPGYGYRRVSKALQRDGWAVNHKRVLRVMRQEALLCVLNARLYPPRMRLTPTGPLPISSPVLN